MHLLLILLLTCSQAIAPALHAHVGGEHYGDGVHLHNFVESGHAGTDIESIEGRVVGMALSLVSRSWKISSPGPQDTDSSPGVTLATSFADITLPLRPAGPRPPLDSSIRSAGNTSYLLPQWRGPPLA